MTAFSIRLALGGSTLLLAGAFAAPSKRLSDPPVNSRLQLVPVVSSSRLEDLEESPDGSRLLTHDRGFAPKLWDPRSMKILRVLGDNVDPVNRVWFANQAKDIVGTSNTSVTVWDSKLARKRFFLSAPTGDNVYSASLSPDGSHLAVSTEKGLLAVVPTEPKVSPQWINKSKAYACLEFGPDGKTLFASGSETQLLAYDATTLNLKATLDTNKKYAGWLRFSRDGKQVLATCSDSRARLFDLSTSKLIFSKPHILGDRGFGATLNAALFVGSKGDGVLTTEKDGTMLVTNRVNGQLIRKLTGHTDSVREIRQSTDGRFLGTYGADEELKLWDVDAGVERPFERPTDLPTAADFSPNGEYFWVGYSNGTLRRHDLASGEIQTTTRGSIQPLESLVFIPGSSRFLTMSSVKGRAFDTRVPVRVWDSEHLNEWKNLGNLKWGVPTVSPDGRHAMMFRPDNSASYVDLVTGKTLFEFNDKYRGCTFSPDGKELLTWHEGKQFFIWDAYDMDKSQSYTTKVAIERMAYPPNGDGLAVIFEDGTAKWIKGNNQYELPKIGGYQPQMVFTPDSQKLCIVDGDSVDVFNAEGKLERKIKLGWVPTSYPLFVTPDGKKIAVDTASLQLFDLATGTKLKVYPEWMQMSEFVSSRHLHPTGKKGLFKTGRYVREVDLDSGEILHQMALNGEAKSMTYSPDGKRVICIDDSDVATIWDVASPSASRRGSFGFSSDEEKGGWIVMDPEGRYDAEDPSKVDGASYVLEWEDGLEPISIPQLKAQFYDPELFSKLMGLSKDPLREVPNLDSLHLYPSLRLSKDKDGSGAYNVSLAERDSGGIGKISISLNGKEVQVKEGIGSFRFDPNDHRQVLLPEPELQNGHGNLLSVQVWNEDGTLSSDPQIVDIGIPKDLKVPDVSLYALCVGVGDYAGNKGDLVAPPKDAEDLSKALSKVAEKLLPGRVHLTKLTTAKDDEQPTRKNILGWFEEVKAKATSRDIILVFFAGHGTSSLGGKKDYFFLTKESDPQELNAASATTGAISGDDLKTLLSKVSATKQVVILDTCHSGAAAEDLVASRSVGGDYQRAWENIKDATGTWLLAGTAADQLSYEASNVDHGILTYALLEAIDLANDKGLRSGSNGDLFVDVERWLGYAANRVESLKSEVGINGIQKPELRRSPASSSFDVGVTQPGQRGMVGLRPPLPIVILGNFEKDQEDPLGLENVLATNFKGATGFKAWFEIPKHPNAYRLAGTYEIDGTNIKVKVVLQKFDALMTRKTLQTYEFTGKTDKLGDLVEAIRAETERRISELAGGGKAKE